MCKARFVFERFTDHARHVLVMAQEESRRLDHPFIGTEHILLGLLNEDNSIARQVLAGVSGLSRERSMFSQVSRHVSSAGA